jgi:hypothetical protein
LARKSTQPETAEAKAPGKSKRKASVSDDDAPLAESSNRPAFVDALARRRSRVLLILGVVGVLGWGAQAAWHRAAPFIAARDRYLVPAERISITDPPDWIVADVRDEVIRSAGLDRRLSILDPALAETVKNAFTLHPWVLSVQRVEKKFPPGVALEVWYRKPVAVVEIPFKDSCLLLPVDDRGVHLPADDVPLIRRKYLPRITGIAGEPPVGQRWEDPRVPGAVEIAALLGDVWEALHLQEITPSTRPEVSMDGARQYFVYELVARGGTRIQWGPAPHARVPGDDAFAVKLKRLNECVREHGPLDSDDAPGTINLRGGLRVGPRMVKKSTPEAVVK